MTTRTLRFYEQQGLIDPLRRGRTRLYRPADRTRLKLILRGKARDIWFTRYGTDDVRLHMCARVRDTQQADILAAEVEALYTNGPAGGGGARAVVRRSLEIVSTLIPRDTVSVSVEMIDA